MNHEAPLALRLRVLNPRSLHTAWGLQHVTMSNVYIFLRSIVRPCSPAPTRQDLRRTHFTHLLEGRVPRRRQTNRAGSLAATRASRTRTYCALQNYLLLMRTAHRTASACSTPPRRGARHFRVSAPATATTRPKSTCRQSTRRRSRLARHRPGLAPICLRYTRSLHLASDSARAIDSTCARVLCDWLTIRAPPTTTREMRFSSTRLCHGHEECVRLPSYLH